MRVVLFCADRGVPLFGPSGASAHLRGVARALHRLGHALTVAVPADHDARGRYDAPLVLGSPEWPAPIRVLTAPPRRWPRGIRTWGASRDAARLARRVRRAVGRADLLWERASPDGRAGGWLARKLGAHHLLELNAPFSLERRPTPGEAERIRAADTVIAVSPWLAAWGERVAGRTVHVVRNGSDLEPVDRGEARRLWSLSGRVAVHPGSGRPWHGADRVPSLLGPGWTGLVVGAVVPGVRSLPQVGQRALAELLSGADALVAPYRVDAPPWFDPLKIHDARAVGLPVVASDVAAGALADLRVPPEGGKWWGEALDKVAKMPRIVRPRPWVAAVEEALRATR